MLLSDVCPSVAYIGPNSRTERPSWTKIGTEVAHVSDVTRDSDTTFKVTRSKVNLLLMSCRNRCHLANKCEDTINLHGEEAYCVATHTAGFRIEFDAVVF